MGFSRQEYWSGLPFPSPGDLPGPGIEPMSLVSPTLAGGFFFTTAPLGISGRGEPSVNKKVYCILLLSSSSVLEIDTLVYLSNRLIYLRKARIFSFSRALLPRREYSRLKSDCF